MTGYKAYEMTMVLKLHLCPTCGAKEDEPCRTPKGRKKDTVHDTRPFSLIPTLNEISSSEVDKKEVISGGIPMTGDEAYELTLKAIEEIRQSGIQVKMQHTTPIEGMKIEDDPAHIKPDKWYHVELYPKTKDEADLIRKKADELSRLGIVFDCGGAIGVRDWELDWSFCCKEKEDMVRKGMMQTVEESIRNLH